MKALVVYESRAGHTRRAAEAIGQAARDQKCSVTIKSVIEVGKSDVEAADVLFVGTWVHGLILFGVRPAGADLWVPTLPSLTGKPVGVFCTYAFNPGSSLRTLGNLLSAQGARVMAQRAFHRSNPGSGAEPFVRMVLQSVERVLA
jgi:flavodoxin